MSTPFRADVVGSLLRPAALRRVQAEVAAGTRSVEQLAAAQDDAVRYVVGLQRDCGLPVATDGEMRRRTYTAPLSEGLEGLAEVPGRYKTWRDAHGNQKQIRQPLAVVDRVKLRESVAVDEYRFARGVAEVPLKVTLPSPLSLISRWAPEISGAAYPDPYELFADCAQILEEVVADLVRSGCEYIQFDAPELTAVVDPDARRELADLGIDDARLLATGCELMNSLAASAAGRARFAMHLCRGNNQGMFLKSGGYERMVATLCEKTPDISTLMLEFDDERSGSFDPLRDVPPDKTLVLGLVSTKRAELEAPAELLTRIEAAARVVPLEQLALSTQCGFSSTAETAPMTDAEQRHKLLLVSEVARQVWG